MGQDLPIYYGLTYACPKTEVNGHSASLGMKYGQHVDCQSLLALYTGITAPNQWLPTFLTMLGWYRSHTLTENVSLKRIEPASKVRVQSSTP